MKKLDLKKDLKHLYKPSTKEVSEVNVPEMNFMMIDGRGNPNTSKEFEAKVGALFGCAYTLKFLSKKELDVDYVVMPLEGLWWAEDMEAFTAGQKDQWLWTIMVMQPDHLTEAHFQAARETAFKKKKTEEINQIRFQSFAEGKAVQIMHLGSYADEAPNIKKLHDHIDASGHRLSGKHHEIYLSDLRRTAPEKLKTVVRQPFA